jgi:hypothetical protein
LVDDWDSGELSTDDFINALIEYGENGPYSAFMIGAMLTTLVPDHFSMVADALWRAVND